MKKLDMISKWYCHKAIYSFELLLSVFVQGIANLNPEAWLSYWTIIIIGGTSDSPALNFFKLWYLLFGVRIADGRTSMLYAVSVT